MTIPNANFVEYLRDYARPRSYYDRMAHAVLLDDKEFMQLGLIKREDIEAYVASAYGTWQMKAGVKGLGDSFVRWRKYRPETPNTCPRCRSRATKIVNLQWVPTPYHCQVCLHSYGWIP